MDREALLALASRVESAAGADRELDALIRCAVFAPVGSIVQQSPINGAWCIYHGEYQGHPRIWEPRNLSQEQRLGAFTASLDAAKTLKHPADLWCVGSMEDGPFARVVPALPGGIYGPEITVHAETVENALTAAFLRATHARALASAQEAGG